MCFWNRIHVPRSLFPNHIPEMVDLRGSPRLVSGAMYDIRGWGTVLTLGYCGGVLDAINRVSTVLILGYCGI